MISVEELIIGVMGKVSISRMGERSWRDKFERIIGTGF